jgi:hypothetical protein
VRTAARGDMDRQKPRQVGGAREAFRFVPTTDAAYLYLRALRSCWKQIGYAEQESLDRRAREGVGVDRLGQARLQALAAGDAELLFAYRRKVYKELTYGERGRPMMRRAQADEEA